MSEGPKNTEKKCPDIWRQWLLGKFVNCFQGKRTSLWVFTRSCVVQKTLRRSEKLQQVELLLSLSQWCLQRHSCKMPPPVVFSFWFFWKPHWNSHLRGTSTPRRYRREDLSAEEIYPSQKGMRNGINQRAVNFFIGKVFPHPFRIPFFW